MSRGGISKRGRSGKSRPKGRCIQYLETLRWNWCRNVMLFAIMEHKRFRNVGTI